jgi:hypothetical protein
MNMLYSTGGFLTHLTDATEIPAIHSYTLLAILRTIHRINAKCVLDVGTIMANNACSNLLLMSGGERDLALKMYENIANMQTPQKLVDTFLRSPNLETASAMMNVLYEIIVAEAYLVASARRQWMNGRHLEYLHRAREVGWEPAGDF